jgi:hypothetical protein
LPKHGGTADSLNWSGYAVTPTNDGITAVSSTFVVPSAGLVPPGFAASWTGIGGYNSSDLIQAGVSENSLPSNSLLGPQYDAWYELLPASETEISGCTGDANCTVSPGDPESSGEWILEAPTVGVQTLLANVGTAEFGPTSTYTQNGTTHTIAQGDPTQIDLSPGLVNEATPSALASDGQSFNVCAYAQSCAAP